MRTFINNRATFRSGRTERGRAEAGSTDGDLVGEGSAPKDGSEGGKQSGVRSTGSGFGAK